MQGWSGEMARVVEARSTGFLASHRTTSFGLLLVGPISFPEWLVVPGNTVPRRYVLPVYPAAH